MDHRASTLVSALSPIAAGANRNYGVVSHACDALAIGDVRLLERD